VSCQLVLVNDLNGIRTRYKYVEGDRDKKRLRRRAKRRNKIFKKTETPRERILISPPLVNSLLIERAQGWATGN
jgi:hypothetical protein